MVCDDDMHQHRGQYWALAPPVMHIRLLHANIRPCMIQRIQYSIICRPHPRKTPQYLECTVNKPPKDWSKQCGQPIKPYGLGSWVGSDGNPLTIGLLHAACRKAKNKTAWLASHQWHGYGLLGSPPEDDGIVLLFLSEFLRSSMDDYDGARWRAKLEQRMELGVCDLVDELYSLSRKQTEMH